MLYFLAIICPPLAVFLCGKPITALVNFVLTLLLWVPGVVHALVVINEHKADARARRLERVVTAAAVANLPPGAAAAAGLPSPPTAIGRILRGSLMLLASFFVIALAAAIGHAAWTVLHTPTVTLPPPAAAQEVVPAPAPAPEATPPPAPKAISGAELTAAQQRAMTAYPDLARAGSPLNREFLARVKTKPPEFFARPNWPAELASESFGALPRP